MKWFNEVLTVSSENSLQSKKTYVKTKLDDNCTRTLKKKKQYKTIYIYRVYMQLFLCMLSVDNLCKHFGQNVLPDLDQNVFGTLMVFLVNFIERE